MDISVIEDGLGVWDWCIVNSFYCKKNRKKLYVLNILSWVIS